MDKVQELKDLIEIKEKEIKHLKSELQKMASRCEQDEACSKDTLSRDEVTKYSRHLIMPEIGVKGQLALKNTSVLIVGAGGLGCPAGLYLAAAGVGKIGIVDYDVVEASNLQRQIAHTEDNLGVSKTSSFVTAVKKLNKSVTCVPYNLHLDEKNIAGIIQQYHIILDASDNVPTRYLLNDAAVLYHRSLISGSALRFEGQLTVYNYHNSLCYRCLFPNPPPPEAVTNCSEGGIIGAVTGVIGSLQAVETIKIAVGLQPSYSGKMLIFDALDGNFRVIKLRGKNPDCDICGQNPSVTDLADYKKFCNSVACDKVQNLKLLSDAERISCQNYKAILDKGLDHVLLDVRPSHEVDICHLPSFINIELSELKHQKTLDKLRKEVNEKGSNVNFVICRRGNNSQLAVELLKRTTKDWGVEWYDIKGGLVAWHDEVDSNFPLY